MNIENRKIVFNYKGNKFLDIVGEKIKNYEYIKFVNIFKNKVLFLYRLFYFDNLDLKSIF